MGNDTKNKLQEIKDSFLETLSKCGTFLLDENDNKVEYYIFEEFDIGLISFFYKDTLETLFKNGLISETVKRNSILLRQLVDNLQNNGEWNIKSFRNSDNWKFVLKLADNIRELELKERLGLESINLILTSSEEMKYAININKDILLVMGNKYVYKKISAYWIDLEFIETNILSIKTALCNPTEPTLLALDNLLSFLFGFKDSILVDVKANEKYNTWNESTKRKVLENFMKYKNIFRKKYGDYTAVVSLEEFYKGLFPVLQ